MGPKPYLKIGIPSSTGCIVEDIVSALKVGRYATGIPVFGSFLPRPWLQFVVQDFDHIIIWLDRDKFPQSLKLQKQIQAFHPNVSVISTDDDPKDLPTIIIRDKIADCTNSSCILPNPHDRTDDSIVR